MLPVSLSFQSPYAREPRAQVVYDSDSAWESFWRTRPPVHRSLRWCGAVEVPRYPALVPPTEGAHFSPPIRVSVAVQGQGGAVERNVREPTRQPSGIPQSFVFYGGSFLCPHVSADLLRAPISKRMWSWRDATLASGQRGVQKSLGLPQSKLTSFFALIPLSSALRYPPTWGSTPPEDTLCSSCL